jgi:hypothetical protein
MVECANLFLKLLKDEGDHMAVFCTSERIRQKVMCKALCGHGPIRARWVLKLYAELKEEFLRLRAADVKFSRRLLLALAKDIFNSSYHYDFPPNFLDSKS